MLLLTIKFSGNKICLGNVHKHKTIDIKGESHKR